MFAAGRGELRRVCAQCTVCHCAIASVAVIDAVVAEYTQACTYDWWQINRHKKDDSPGRCRFHDIAAMLGYTFFSDVTMIKTLRPETRRRSLDTTPKPRGTRLAWVSSSRNLKSMPASGKTRQPLDDKPAASQLDSAGKEVGPRRAAPAAGTSPLAWG